MQMLIMLWRMLARLLRTLGWGILLVPVAAMSVALYGLTVWTAGAVVLAAIVALWRPLMAARLLPLTMVWAGISGLVVAAHTPGSPVSVFFKGLQVPLKTTSLAAAAIRGGMGKPPGPPPNWSVQSPPALKVTYTYVTPKGLQVLYSPKAMAGAIKHVTGSVSVLPQKAIVEGSAVIRRVIDIQALPPKNVAAKLFGPPVNAFPVKGPPPGLRFGAGPPVPEKVAAFQVAGLWHGRLLVPVALLLLTLGLWLTPRSLAGLRSRAATLVPDVRQWIRENRWGVLLVPVTLIGLTIFGVHPWTVAAVLASLVVLVRWPKVAADLVPITLAIFAVRGFALASDWQSMAAALQGPAFGQPPAGLGDQYAAVLVNSPSAALLAGAEASVFLAFGAWLVPRTIAAHARTVFTPGTDVELAGRVQRLTESRSHAVDAATSELRRIERDLHDGAQARLVALGMNLRAVERVLPTNPQAAQALVAEAREASVRALSELRDLIRGICPPVLADRGLGHAVRALALDTPLPIELDIDLPGRLSAPVESACYFAIAEALANAVKHSGARHVQIRIKHAADTLRIEVADDGVGGADPAQGTGLQGVERRLGTFDGILAVSSPPGGPTMIVMEVPCALSSPKTSSS
jgi:signal transduction histidine kinase